MYFIKKKIKLLCVMYYLFGVVVNYHIVKVYIIYIKEWMKLLEYYFLHINNVIMSKK